VLKGEFSLSSLAKLKDPAPTSPNAAGDLFETDHLQHNLRARSIRGGMVTFGSQSAKLLISMVSAFSLARLLNPADFGIVAMVSPIAGFISLFQDLGLSMATVQKEKITHEQTSTLFWVNVCISVLLALFTVAISPLVGWFYGDYRTIGVTMAIAGTFLFGGLASQHHALLQRNMRFRTLAIIEITMFSSGVAVGIFTASRFVGWGYWSLVAMNLTSGFVNCIGLWWASSWRPGRPRRHIGTRALVKFGGRITFATVMAYVATQLDRLALGRFYNPVGTDLATPDELLLSRKAALGVYVRSQSMFITPLQQIMMPLNYVMVPLFSRLVSDRERLRAAAGHVMEIASAVMLPVAIGSFFCATEIVHVMLGKNPQWAAAIPVTRAFALMAITLPVGLVVNALFVATGRTDVLVKWEAAWTALILISLPLALYWGPVGVALVLGTGHLITAPVHIYIAHRVMQIDFKHCRALVVQNVTSVVLCGAAIWMAQPITRELSDLVRAALLGLLILLTHALTLYMFGATYRMKRTLQAIWPTRGGFNEA